jgi:hypothetical protein
MMRIRIIPFMFVLFTLVPRANARDALRPLEVAVVLDRTGTYRAELPRAVTQTDEIIRQLVAQRHERWERGVGHVTIISLDAVPAELRRLPLEDFQQPAAQGASPASGWSDAFTARGDYEHCTNITAGFTLAANRLAAAPANADKYIIAFSDLIHDPPLRDSLRSCANVEAPAAPPADFPWESLNGIAVSVYGVPPAQIIPWKTAIEAHHLADSFHLYTPAETAAAQIQAPHFQENRLTPEERAALREHLATTATSFVSALGRVAVFLVVAIVVFLCLAVIVARRRRGDGTWGPDQGEAPPERGGEISEANGAPHADG